jgi:deazaflavin-dependent oxidoreductase (nitroreductase family)
MIGGGARVYSDRGWRRLGGAATVRGMAERRYVAPGLGTRLFNLLPTGLAALGVSVWGSRTLAVRGRRSGEWRTVPVNLLEHDGRRYLVAPRGETHWVRNLRAAGTGELRLGRRREIFTAREVTDGAEKVTILRAYLRKWAFEVNQFFQGIGADAPDAEIARIAPGYPVFRID